MSDESERLDAIEKRLDRLEGRSTGIGVNPSGVFFLGTGVRIESAYDYKTGSQHEVEPPVVVPEAGWYTASLDEANRPRLSFHGAR